MQCTNTNSIEEHLRMFILTCSSPKEVTTGPNWPNGSQVKLGQMDPMGPRPTGPKGPSIQEQHIVMEARNGTTRHQVLGLLVGSCVRVTLGVVCV